jgi:dihydroxyacetone kinase-like protein
MKGSELVALLDRAMERLATSRDELRDLDAALGDGDLGVTVNASCLAVRAKLADLDDPSPGQVLRSAGLAVANANPSTMAALVGGALLAAAKVAGDSTALSRADALRLGRAAAESIALRGKAELGDKTMLDAILPSLDVFEATASTDPETLALMVAAARRAVDETTPLRSRRGRAAWVGERSIGHPDPGATAYLRLLEALSAVWPSETQV